MNIKYIWVLLLIFFSRFNDLLEEIVEKFCELGNFLFSSRYPCSVDKKRCSNVCKSKYGCKSKYLWRLNYFGSNCWFLSVSSSESLQEIVVKCCELGIFLVSSGYHCSFDLKRCSTDFKANYGCKPKYLWR